jgi:hypothetical protein
MSLLCLLVEAYRDRRQARFGRYDLPAEVREQLGVPPELQFATLSAQRGRALRGARSAPSFALVRRASPEAAGR